MARMNAAEKAKTRVAVAKDVLKQLKAKKIRAQSNYGYCVPDDAGPCMVCALGAAMVSRLRIKGAWSLVWRSSWWDRGAVTEELSDCFSHEQMLLIEDAFESGPNEHYSPPATPGELFGARYRSDRGRLKAIMENIIANKGTFAP